MTRIFKAGLALLAAAFAVLTLAHAATPEIYLHKKWEYAVDGYDVTSYFDGEPVKGDPLYAADVANATFIFASQENLDTFLADPAAYRPAYGGHCAYAIASREVLVKGDPEFWTVYDGVLYLNFNKRVQKKWLANIDNMIAKGDALWPEILDK